MDTDRAREPDADRGLQLSVTGGEELRAAPEPRTEVMRLFMPAPGGPVKLPPGQQELS